MIDIHVHMAALALPANGCLVSERMRRSMFFRYAAWKYSITSRPPEEINNLYLDSLRALLAASGRVKRAVLLAMDGAYGADGNLDEARTDFLVSNDAVFDAAARHSCFIPGASINPVRKDALDELERCAAKGAVLVKFLPNSQNFNPADKRFIQFYRRMAELGISLLSHTGLEFCIKSHGQCFGDLDNLRLPLEQGVNVVAAHGCSTGAFLYERHYNTMLRFTAGYPNFFIDVSALTHPHRAGMLFKLRRHPEIFSRLVFGSDYPTAAYVYPALIAFNIKGYAKAAETANYFDRLLETLDAVGLKCGADITAALPRLRA